MIALAVAMGIGRFVYTPILPGMMGELGLSAADAGLIASANYLGYLAGALIAAGGWAEGRERMLMLGGLAASAALALAMGLTDSFAAFLALRFLAGIASAFVLVFVTTIVFGRLAKAGRNELQALHFGGVGVGISTSAIMMAALLSAGAAWSAGWLWAGAISAVGFLAVAGLVGRDEARAGPSQPEPALPIKPALTRIIVAYGLFGFGYIVTATFLVAIVREGEGGRLFEAGVWLAAGLAGIPSVWLWTWLSLRMGTSAAYGLACTVEAVGVVASVALGGTAGPLIAAVLLGGTFIAITSLGLQIGRQLAPQAPRRALALMTASFGLGQILGPVFAGLAAEVTGGFFVPSIGAALVLLASAAIAPRLAAGQKLP